MSGSLDQAVLDIAEWVLSILPDSPFQFLTEMANDTFGEWIAYLNWCFPVYAWLSILEGWITAILVYYIFQIVLRWVKAIE